MPFNSNALVAYNDSYWGDNLDDRSSTSAYTIYFEGNPISWSFKKKQFVAQSSTEVEFRAIANTVFELCWLRNLLIELRIHFPKPVLLCDNLRATFVSTNPMYHSKMKHVEVDFYFVRDKIAKGLLTVLHILSERQLADSLAKPLTLTLFAQARSKIGIHDGTPLLRGHNRTRTWLCLYGFILFHYW